MVPFPQASDSDGQYLSQPQQTRSGFLGWSGAFKLFAKKRSSRQKRKRAVTVVTARGFGIDTAVAGTPKYALLWRSSPAVWSESTSMKDQYGGSDHSRP